MEGRTAAKSAQQKAKEADLRQKEARLEKISKEELTWKAVMRPQQHAKGGPR